MKPRGRVNLYSTSAAVWGAVQTTHLGGRPYVSEIGILPSQAIQKMIESGSNFCGERDPGCPGPAASIDLRLGQVAYRVQASFLPGRGVSVADELNRFAMHQIDLSKGAVLERGCIYVVPLMERLSLPDGVDGTANAKALPVGLISSPGFSSMVETVLTGCRTAMTVHSMQRSLPGPFQYWFALVPVSIKFGSVEGRPELTHQEMIDLHRDMRLFDDGSCPFRPCRWASVSCRSFRRSSERNRWVSRSAQYALGRCR